MMSLDDFATAMNNWVWSMPLFFMLLGCGLIFSIASKFVQWRILSHGLSCVRGDYDSPDDVGHINHFQALCAALSATIGLGNIAGVAVAVSLGGPGAIFWMWVIGVFGMALKFMECTLAVMYRDVRDMPTPSGDSGDTPQVESVVRGGPMWYMQKALVEPLRSRGNPFWVVFKILAVLFAASTVLNSFGGGNMFQGWNVADMLDKHFNVSRNISAIVVSGLVAMVIIGGIKRIGNVAATLVPLMCLLYVGGAFYVIVLSASEVPYYLGLIVKSAFTPIAETGACAGVSVWIAFTWGMKRACFSNEAGEGSAAMAHAAAKTDEPIREGIVAGLGPFIDTIIICTMSALVLLMSGTWNRPPVGKITKIDGNHAIITCGEDIPENMESLYLDRVLDTNGKLSVHTVRAASKELATQSIPIESVQKNDGSQWSDLQTVTLNLANLTKDERETILVGQVVHLNLAGAEMTGFAFDTTFKGFGKYIVTLGVCLFAFSTMISWSYYGEKGAEYLLGPRAILPFKFIFVIFVFLGMTLPEFSTVYTFSDATTGLMVIFNLPAVLILSPHVLRASKKYFARLDAGEMPKVKK